MANILSYVRRLFTTRKHERFKVQIDTFVIVSPGRDKEKKFQVIDISQGGLAFIYHGSKEDIETSGFLNMLAESPNLEKVNFDTVSDKTAPEFTYTSLPTRRRGVKFTWMGVLRETDLKNFIKSRCRGW